MEPSILIIGVLAICLSVFIFVLKRAGYRHWQKALGTVIAVVRQDNNFSDNNSLPTFAPRVSFQTASGVAIEFLSEVSSFPAPKVGDKVRVLYDPDDPKEATIDGFMNKHLLELILFGIGLGGVLISFLQRFAS